MDHVVVGNDQRNTVLAALHLYSATGLCDADARPEVVDSHASGQALAAAVKPLDQDAVETLSESLLNGTYSLSDYPPAFFTVLAALVYYARCGQGEPIRRTSGRVHALAGGYADIRQTDSSPGLCQDGVEVLIETLRSGYRRSMSVLVPRPGEADHAGSGDRSVVHTG